MRLFNTRATAISICVVVGVVGRATAFPSYTFDGVAGEDWEWDWCEAETSLTTSCRATTITHTQTVFSTTVVSIIASSSTSFDGSSPPPISSCSPKTVTSFVGGTSYGTFTQTITDNLSTSVATVTDTVTSGSYIASCPSVATASSCPPTSECSACGTCSPSTSTVTQILTNTVSSSGSAVISTVTQVSTVASSCASVPPSTTTVFNGPTSCSQVLGDAGFEEINNLYPWNLAAGNDGDGYVILSCESTPNGCVEGGQVLLLGNESSQPQALVITLSQYVNVCPPLQYTISFFGQTDGPDCTVVATIGTTVLTTATLSSFTLGWQRVSSLEAYTASQLFDLLTLTLTCQQTPVNVYLDAFSVTSL